MKKKAEKMIALVMCAVMIIGIAPLSGFVGIDLPDFGKLFTNEASAATSGTCGDNLTWEYVKSTQTLTINGTGAMKDYKYINIYVNFPNTPWYSYSSYIKTVEIATGVTRIGNYAFYNCSGLTEITIPDSVTSIGSNAFYNCTGLTSITIPNSVTSIGSAAFYGCTGLTSVTIGNGVISIGNSPFANCTGLTSITVDSGNTDYHSKGNCLIETESKTLIAGCKNSIIPGDGSVTSIGWDAFSGCSSLTEITIPDSVISISGGAFSNCTALTSVTIGNSVTSIGSNAFYNCTGLTSITIPDSVTSIGSNAFYNCTGLTSITIPNSVTSIGWHAFDSCTSLTSVAIGNGVTSIGEYAFYGCTGLKSIIVDSANTIYRSEGNCLIETESKTLIMGCKDSIIPDNGSVTSIGDSAFRGCTGLTSITIPDSVTSIGDFAFYNCTGLKDVYFTGSVEEWNEIEIGNENGKLLNASIHYYLYYPSVSTPTDPTHEHSYNSVLTVTPNCTTAGEMTYICKCGDFYTEIIPAFGHSWDEGIVEPVETEPGLPYVTHKDYFCTVCGETYTEIIPPTTGYITPEGLIYDIIDGEVSIIGCDKNIRGELIIPGTIDGYPVTSIGDSVFYWCMGLTSITIPDSITSIGDAAFEYCHSLTSITIPDSVIRIGCSAFYHCIGLKRITIPDSVTSIGESAFSYCTGVTTVTIGNNVTSIGDFAFYGCSRLTSITIPDGVTSIGVSAFYNTGYYNAEENWTDNVLYLGNHLVDAKPEITGDYSIKANTKTVADYALAGCTGLTGTTIPDSVTSIGDSAFRDCTGLTSIIIPDSVISIGSSAFYNSGYYNREVNWIDNVLYIGNHLIIAKTTITGDYSIIANTKTVADNAFYCCTGLKCITIPDSVTSIGDSAFEECTGLTSVTIPNSVKSISDCTFYGCTGLTSITIPDSVTSIGDFTFSGCNGLTDIYFTGSEEEWNVIDIDDGNDCLLNVDIHFNSGKPFISGEIDKTAVVRGNQGVWTVKTTDVVEWMKFNVTYTTSAGNTYNSSVYFKAANYMNAAQGVTVSDNNGERIWTVPMTFNYASADDSLVQIWSVFTKSAGSALWVDSGFSKDITVAKTKAILNPVSETYLPYSIVSAACDADKIAKGDRGTITVVTTSDCTKVRVTYTDAATGKAKASTFQTTSKNNVSFTDDETTGLRTWTIGFKFAAPAKDDEFRIDTRGVDWTEAKTVNVEVK